MKTQIKQKFLGAIALLGLSMLSYVGNAQEHLTLSLENITSTASTIEYDLYIVNDGSTDIKLAGCAFGVNYNNMILNGAVASENSYQFIPGTKAQALSGLSAYSVQNTQNDKFSQLRLTMSPALKNNSATLAKNVPYKVGRFVFANSTNWASNSNPSFSLNEFNVPGISTSCAIAYVNNSTHYKGFSTALKNLTCKVVPSPMLNPGGIQVDENGNATASALVRTENGVQQINTKQDANAQSATYVSIYPNPTQDMVHVDFQVTSTVNTLVKVMDIRGRIVKKIQARSEKGFNTMSVSLREVPAGVYNVQVYQDNKLTFTDKVTKKD
ncbi:MAG: T9SS type A sorting domain-containing protein [Bacteroidetes bacterium]|nr:T9SS type A sorting domain-containing protein [Bacteroidota bacterium]